MILQISAKGLGNKTFLHWNVIIMSVILLNVVAPQLYENGHCNTFVA